MTAERYRGSESPESRRDPRCKPPEGTLVILSPGSDKEWTVQAIDISKGGMAFVYRGERNDLDASGMLKILAEHIDINRIEFQTVHDSRASEDQGSVIPLRRRGVKFVWKGDMKKEDLELFIKSFCT